MNDNKVQLDDVLRAAAGGDPIPTDPEPAELETDPVDPTDPADPVETDPADPTDPTDPADPAPKSEDKKPEDKKPNHMKDLRDRYNTEKSARERIDLIMRKYTEGDYKINLKDYLVDGQMDYDTLLEDMEVADVAAKASSKGISPEVQAEIDRIERDKIELEKQRLQVTMDRELTNMQLDLGIKSADVNNFFKDALALNKNPYRWLAQGGNLTDLYNLVYRDKLTQSAIDKAIEAAKGTWEAEREAALRTPAPNPAQPKQSAKVDPDGFSLAKLLEEAARNKK